MVRTIEEVKAGYITVTITVDSAPSGVADLSAAELAAEVTRLAAELGEALISLRHRENQVEILRDELATAVLGRRGAEANQRGEQNRADLNEGWAQRTELRLSKDKEAHLRRVSELTDSLAARDRLLDKATRQLGKVSSEVHGVETSAALHTPWTSWREVDAEALTRTVLRVRTILGTVERSPEPTDPGTSQA